MLQPWRQIGATTFATQGAVTAAAATDLAPNLDWTIPPNTFQVGTKLHIHAIGIISTTTGTNTMTFSVQMGATVISQALGAITLIASQTNQKWELDLWIECRAAGNGTQTTFIVQGTFKCSPALLAATTQLLPASGAAVVGTGVDATASQQLKLMGTWSAVSNSLTVEQAEFEIAA